jgi:hypothetical protein
MNSTYYFLAYKFFSFSRKPADFTNRTHSMVEGSLVMDRNY